MANPYEAHILKKVNRRTIAKLTKKLGPAGKQLLEEKLSKKGFSPGFIDEIAKIEKPPKE